MKLRKAVFLAIVAASLTAASLVAVDSLGWSMGRDHDLRRVGRRQFQGLVGGLGLGSHTDLSRCPWLFDPRVAGDDHAVLGCLPGDPGGFDWHAISIFPVPLSETADPVDDDEPRAAESAGNRVAEGATE